MRMKIFCQVLFFILISFKTNNWFFSLLNDAFSALIWDRPSIAGHLLLVLLLLLSPEQLARACALVAALSLGWDSRKGRLCNNCLEPLEYPWFWLWGRDLGVSHPRLNRSPFSCPPGHELQVPAGNSLPGSPFQSHAVQRHQWDAQGGLFLLQLQVAVFVWHHLSWEVCQGLPPSITQSSTGTSDGHKCGHTVWLPSPFL